MPGLRTDSSGATGPASYDEPTLGVLVDGELYYIANAQWERFGEDGRVAKPDALKTPAVLRLRL